MYWAYKNWRVLLIALALIILLCIVGWLAWRHNNDREAKLQQAQTMTADQATNINYLQNALNQSKQNAEMLAAYIKAAQSGQVAPSVTFVQQSPTVEKAAETVKDRINTGDKTLPSAALEKTDRTAVVPQEVTQKDGSKEWQVGVYKVNNYRNWEWSAGYGQHGGDRYVPVEVQRNFSKDAAVSYEHHFGGKPGWEVKYTRKTDKVLFLF